MENKRYFKITNAEENHHGFQYVNGLNVLDKPFKEKGSCVVGGLYFSDAENILKYLDYGIYLREITFPESDPNFKMVLDPEGNKWRANKIILGKKYNLSDVSTFEFLISLGTDLRKHTYSIMGHACTHGYLEIVKYLTNKYVNHEYRYDSSLQLSAQRGHLEIVRFLLEKGVDPQANNNFAVRWASARGHLEVVKLLIEKGADFRACNDCALVWASKYGRTEVVEFLRNIHQLI